MTARAPHSRTRRPSRRRHVFAVTALSLAVCAAGGTAASAEAAPACAHAGKGIKKNAKVRVYRKGSSGGDLGAKNYYACDLKKGKVTKLNPPADFGGGDVLINTLRIAGTRVAFAAVIPTGCCADEELDVVDATKRHRRRTFGAGLEIDHNVTIRKIALKSNGDVAWVAKGCTVNAAGEECIGDDPDGPLEFQVWAANRTSVHKLHLLAHGGAISPKSIALTTTLVKWTDGGAPMEAPIP
jgi:hypothetical protein